MMLIDEDTGLLSKPAAPWHLWIVGSLAILWNGVGAADYAMTHLQHEDYMMRFTEEQKLFLQSLPVWAILGWTASVFSAVAGSLLVFFRSRFAETAFLISLAGMAVLFAHAFLSGRPELLGGPGYAAGMLLATAIGLALYFYARHVRVDEDQT